MTIELAGAPASLIESIRFDRKRRNCAWGNDHNTYRISHAGRDGTVSKAVTFCFGPTCDNRPWRRQVMCESCVLLASYVGWPPPSVVAIAYLIAFGAPRLEVVARTPRRSRA